MRREVVENANLSIFAEVGIVIFVIAFILVLIRVFFMKKSKEDELGRIPLDDGTDFDSNGDEVTA